MKTFTLFIVCGFALLVSGFNSDQKKTSRVPKKGSSVVYRTVCDHTGHIGTSLNWCSQKFTKEEDADKFTKAHNEDRFKGHSARTKQCDTDPTKDECNCRN